MPRRERRRKFIFDKEKDAFLIEALCGAGWRVIDGELTIDQKKMSKLTKDFPSVVLSLQPDYDDPHRKKTYRFRLPAVGVNTQADITHKFIRDRGYAPDKLTFTYAEYTIPRGDAERIPNIWKYQHGKDWKWLNNTIEYRIKKGVKRRGTSDMVQFKGTHTTYRENGEFTVPIKGEFPVHEIQDYGEKGPPDKDRLIDRVMDEIDWALEEMEQDENAPWNVINSFGVEKLDGEFKNVEFEIVDNQVSVSGILNDQPVDMQFNVYEVDDYDPDDPFESVREHVKESLAITKAIPTEPEVKRFLSSGELDQYLPHVPSRKVKEFLDKGDLDKLMPEPTNYQKR